MIWPIIVHLFSVIACDFVTFNAYLSLVYDKNACFARSLPKGNLRGTSLEPQGSRAVLDSYAIIFTYYILLGRRPQENSKNNRLNTDSRIPVQKRIPGRDRLQWIKGCLSIRSPRTTRCLPIFAEYTCRFSCIDFFAGEASYQVRIWELKTFGKLCRTQVEIWLL